MHFITRLHPRLDVILLSSHCGKWFSKVSHTAFLLATIFWEITCYLIKLTVVRTNLL